MRRRVFVTVPGSSANLGAGFDCIAVAVNRSLSITAWLDGQAPASTLERMGTLEEGTSPPHEDLIARGFDAACSAVGRERPRGLQIRATSEIPTARGLGSSAAALVGGALAANELLQLGRTATDIVVICSRVEGHGDNVAASVFGGATLILWPSSSHVSQLRVSPQIAFILAIPAFRSTTKEARAVLPGSVEFSTTVRAVSRSAALVHGLATGDPGLLSEALDDVVHVPYRKHLVRGYDDVTGAARAAGAFGATLSGSGSSIVAIASVAAADRVADAMRLAWERIGVDAKTFVSSGSVTGASSRTQVEPD